MTKKLLLSTAVIISCLLQSCVIDEEPQGTALTTGDSLPEFSARLNDNTIVSNVSLKGKTGVIIFFNTSCSDCRRELPVVEKVWEKFRENPDIVFAAISREEGSRSIKDYWEENHLTLPYSAQTGREIFSLFAPSGIPRIYISNPEGKIIFASSDHDMPDEKQLTEAIVNLQ